MIFNYLKLRFYRPLKKYFGIKINFICLSLVISILINLSDCALLIASITILTILILKLKIYYLLVFLICLISSNVYIQSIPTEPTLITKPFYIATVVSEPLIKDYEQEITLQLEGNAGLSYAKTDKYSDIDIGNILIISGRISPIESAGNLSEFDYKRFLLSKKITSEIKNIKIISIDKNPSFITSLYKLKSELKSKIEQTLAEPDSSLLSGILFGEDSNLPQELAINLKNSGVYHIISVSGFNVGIIFTLINSILSKIISRRPRIIFSLLTVFIFTLFIGLDNLPVLRASLMLFFIYLASYFGRKVTAISALLLSTGLLLIYYPFYIFNLSFLLSTFATLGIVLLGKLYINIATLDSLKSLLEDLKTSLYAILSTSIITFLSFKQLNFSGLITNIFVLPFIPLLMLSGILIIIFKYLNLDLFLYLIKLATTTLLNLIYIVIDFISNNIYLAFDNLQPLFICLLIIIFIDYFKFKKEFNKN